MDGRSFFCFFSAVTSKLFSQLLLQRYSFIRAARFFLNSLYFFGSKYFLFSRSDLFLAASLISYSFPFSLGVIRENIALPRINCHTNLFGTVKTENLYRTTCSFLDRFYSNPCLFSPFLFWFDDDIRLNSWNTQLLGASFKSKHSNYTFDLLN